MSSRSRWFAVVALAAFAPATPAEEPLRRIAFGSCASQEKPQPIWDAVVGVKPDLFLLLGDNIYGDTDNIEVLRAKYAQFGAVPGYQKLLKTCPVYATWDDHDYGTDDSGVENPNKVASQKAFLDFFREPADSPRRTREGVYVAMLFGPEGKRVQVILLDTRYFRSKLAKKGRDYVPTTDSASTFLGEAQWTWLEQQLRVPADLRLIGSSIQVVAEEHPFEKWANIPSERTRFFKLLKDTKANGVVVLSGDRHLAELSQADAGLGYPLFDLTSSGLNMGNRRWRPTEVNRHRVATMTSGDNFGLVTIDWDRSPPQVGLQVRDVTGDVAFQQKLDLSLLQPGTSASPAVASSGPTPKTPGAVGPAEAAKKVGESVVLEMTVAATGKARDNSRVFLNSLTEFREPANFTVVLDMRVVAEKLKAAGIDDPAKQLKGKTVTVRGKVSLFQDRPQIVVTDAEQLKLAGP